MRLFMAIKIAKRALGRNLMRSLLTMLGVIIGVRGREPAAAPPCAIIGAPRRPPPSRPAPSATPTTTPGAAARCPTTAPR